MRRIPLILLSLFLLTSCGVLKNKEGGYQLDYQTKKKFQHYYYEASKQKILGNSDEALLLFEKALKADPRSHASMYQLANVYYGKKQLQGAIYWAEKAVEANPDFNFWYYGQLGQFYNRGKDFDKSAKIFEFMIKQEPHKRSNYAEASNQYFNAGALKSALNVLNKYQEKFGVDEVSARKIEGIYFRMSKPENAIKAIQRLVEQDPENMKYLGLLSETYKVAKQPNMKVEVLNRMLSIEPTNGYAHFALAEYFRKQGKRDLSYDHLKKAFFDIKLDIKQKLNVLGSFMMMVSVSPEIRKQAEELTGIIIKVHPTDPMGYIALSDIQFADLDFENSRLNLRHALALDPSDPKVWQKLLLIDDKLENHQAIVTDSKDAIELFPNQLVFILYNAYSNLILEEYADAIESANYGLEISINKADKIQFLNILADAYNKLKEFNKSDEAFKSLFELNPKDELALNNYAYYLAERNENLEFALEMIESARALDSSNPLYLDTHAWVLYRLKRYEEARNMLEQALKQQPNEYEINFHFGQVLIALGQVEQGNIYIKKSKELENQTNP
jgi:tetratricopeptide (TPR) repeat protein